MLRDELKEIMQEPKECLGVGCYGSALLTEGCITEVIDAFLRLVAEAVEGMPEQGQKELSALVSWRGWEPEESLLKYRKVAKAERANIVAQLKEG